MTFRTFTADMVDRVEEINDRLDEIDEEIDGIEIELENLMEAQGVSQPSDVEEYDEYEEKYEELQGEKIRLTGEKRAFLDAIVHWKTDLDITNNPPHEEVEERFAEVDECLFEIEELSFGQVQAVQDDMVEKSFDMDINEQDLDGTPKQGYMQKELIKESLVRWPEEAPEETYMGSREPKPGDYPDEVAEWLFEKVDAYNTTQEESMGNLSLEERMT